MAAALLTNMAYRPDPGDLVRAQRLLEEALDIWQQLMISRVWRKHLTAVAYLL